MSTVLASTRTTVHAYATANSDSVLEPFEYELGPIGPYDVDINVRHCGVCHSDLSMLKNEWDMTQYPVVPGHEMTGLVSTLGEHVTHLQIGDPVGLGWQAGYCMTCEQCLSGHHNLCTHVSNTIIGRHGGFADKVRAQAASVIKLPRGLDMSNAGPLFCAGVTVFNPLMQFNIPPTAAVGVVGIGGLGHLALQFAHAWGCRVTAFTNQSKQDEAIQLGAHDTINSRNPDEINAAEGRFDFLLSTVNVKLDWNAYLKMLKPGGRLHLVGVVTDPLDLDVAPMLFGQRCVSSSPVGGPAILAKMLDFAAQHDIKPVTEHFPMSRINDAMERLRSGKTRYRIVLNRD